MNTFMVFDVESIGLHGEGFAVAWVVVNRDGERLGEGCMACDPAQCKGTDESRLWVAENVPPLEFTSPTKQHLRNSFWYEWRHWADRGALLVADCAWPVEANFLSACVNLNHVGREWQGPYPLHDLASILLALGSNPLAVTNRMPDELPAHHPLMDARQSARQLVAALTTPPNPKDRAMKIEPCPFCGHVGLEFSEGSTFRWIIASCGGCSATTGETRIQTLGQGTKDEWMAAAQADAIDQWNRRTPPNGRDVPLEAE